MERDLVNEFKHEYQAVLHSRQDIRRLEDRIAVLDNKLAAHSPSLNGPQGTPRSHDERLADIITRKDKLTRELAYLRASERRIEEITSLMDPEIVNAMRKVYTGQWDYQTVGDHIGKTRRGAQNTVNREIEKAMRKYRPE